MQLSLAVLTALAASVNCLPLQQNSPQSQFSSKPYSQEALDRYDVIRFLGTGSPYISSPGYGISRDTPNTCNVTQVHSINRHGERYPSKGTGKDLTAKLDRIRNYTGQLTGELAFLPTYEFAALDGTRYDSESNRGPYNGLGHLYNTGAQFRNRYNHLWLEVEDKSNFKFYSASQKRVVDSAVKFAEGFLGHGIENSTIVSLSESNLKQGANSLTPGASCANFNKTVNAAYAAEYNITDVLNRTVARFNSLTPDLDINITEADALLQYCAWDLNVIGSSRICDLFTTDEFLAKAYQNDVSYYYAHGPGQNYTAAIGSTYTTALFKLLKDDSLKITNSFTHDTDIMKIHSTLGTFDDPNLTPESGIYFNQIWRTSDIVPMGGGIIFERLSCAGSDEPFVRIVVNDAVIPIYGHASGPGYSVPLSEFEDYVNQRLENRYDYAKDCNLEDGAATELTFFWDNIGCNCTTP